MKVFSTIAELCKQLDSDRNAGKKIGLVPTMGALHNGHLQLVKTSVANNDVTVVSIFVNPTQFNDKNDLLLYPRTLDKDCQLLESVNCDYAFAPSVEEIYPTEDTRTFHLGKVAEVMEGKYRPGHFNGVAQIVSKLFDIVNPDNAYFGEKDFQQIAVIRAMAAQMGYTFNIIAVPIVRESDGLALSSRNTRLTESQRRNAPKIAETLFKSRTFAASHTVSETQKMVEEAIEDAPGLRLEYFEIVDGNTLQKVSSWEDSLYVVGCITVFCGEVRLIDNIKYKEI